jgi:pSer/pThr/pTyr-binding forkhead associated (FHA) protein
MAPPIAHSFAPTPTHATHSSLAPPLPPPFRPPLPAPSVHRTARLWVLYEGQRHPVDGPAFVVGRGKQGVQLVIKDPNVSRRHALIELQDGRYWIADLGSVNGVEVNGVRIARKPIEHGDVLKVCDHTLKFSFE